MLDLRDPTRVAQGNHPPLPLLHHVAYCSLASDGVGDREVSRIVDSAQRHNLARNITGVLAFASGVFFQWIEGPRAQIERLLEILHRDKRHHHIVTLSKTEEVRARLYPDWDMEPVAADYVREMLMRALDAAGDANDIAALNRILARLDAGSFESPGVR